jgi:hypothetical protein
MCNPPVNQHSGTMINDLINVVYSSVDTSDVWEVLTHARRHICAHEMTAGDVQAWYLMADLQENIVHEELARLQIRPKIRQCQACEGGGENPPQCPKPAVGDGFFCDEHYEE